VIDLFSRRVVGWSMRASMTADLVAEALTMALWRRGKPDALIHHSDRGSQYTSDQFDRLMSEHGVAYSMSRAGNCWANAATDGVFPRSRPSEQRAKPTAHAKKPRPICSIMSSDGTIHGDAIRRSAISA
jgi:putative transposase